MVYVAHGAAKVAGLGITDDQAAYAHGEAEIFAGDGAAAIWRWELAPIGDATILAAGASRVKLSTPIGRLAASSVLMRADSVAFPPGGCAYLHTHQGPGIRCLIEGGIRIDAESASTCYAPGGAWFEAGPVPVFAQAAQDRASRFIRVMILPAELKGRSSIGYVNSEDRDKPKSQLLQGLPGRDHHAIGAHVRKTVVRNLDFTDTATPAVLMTQTRLLCLGLCASARQILALPRRSRDAASSSEIVQVSRTPA